jgi:hypothetical protein
MKFLVLLRLASCVSMKFACQGLRVFCYRTVCSESRSGLRAGSLVYKQTSVFLSDLGVHWGLQNCRMLLFLSFWSGLRLRTVSSYCTVFAVTKGADV